MSATSVVIVPCDRCGRQQPAGGNDAPFSFCASCGMFVCSTCRSRGEVVCDACAEARDAASGAAPSSRPKRKGRASGRRAKRRATEAAEANATAGASSDRPVRVTSLNITVRDVSRRGRSVAVPSVSVLAPSPKAPPDLVPVGPGAAAVEAPPRWVKRLPDPFVVRVANRLTDGHAFGLIVATLIGLGVLVGAWAVATGQRFDDGVPAGLPAIVEQSSAAPSASAPLATSDPVVSSQRRYFVRSGDTLRTIAARVYGDEARWEEILEANRDEIDDPDHLTTGANLWIPLDDAAH
jgi:nucleoid-associated protein YgaU